MFGEQSLDNEFSADSVTDGVHPGEGGMFNFTGLNRISPTNEKVYS